MHLYGKKTNLTGRIKNYDKTQMVKNIPQKCKKGNLGFVSKRVFNFFVIKNLPEVLFFSKIIPRNKIENLLPVKFPPSGSTSSP